MSWQALGFIRLSKNMKLTVSETKGVLDGTEAQNVMHIHIFVLDRTIRSRIIRPRFESYVRFFFRG